MHKYKYQLLQNIMWWYSGSDTSDGNTMVHNNYQINVMYHGIYSTLYSRVLQKSPATM